jgi:hypothetical protein
VFRVSNSPYREPEEERLNGMTASEYQEMLRAEKHAAAAAATARKERLDRDEQTLKRLVRVLNVLIFLAPLLVGIFIGYAVLR